MKYGSTIKNPLTIIAIFAGIAEISGTIVLPFVAAENQRLYIYFLIFFPTLLVVVFFATLNLNHSVLYAPSDWKDEANFFKRLSPASEKEGKRKVEEEINEADVNLNNEQDSSCSDDSKKDGNASDENTNSNSDGDGVENSYSSRNKLKEKYLRAEGFGINKLQTVTGLNFSRNVRFEPNESRSIVFDGMSISGNDIHIAEIKYINSADSIRLSIERVMQRFQAISRDFEQANKNMILHLVYVIGENESVSKMNSIVNAATHRAKKYNVNFKIYHYNYSDIEYFPY